MSHRQKGRHRPRHFAHSRPYTATMPPLPGKPLTEASALAPEFAPADSKTPANADKTPAVSPQPASA